MYIREIFDLKRDFELFFYEVKSFFCTVFDRGGDVNLCF